MIIHKLCYIIQIRCGKMNASLKNRNDSHNYLLELRLSALGF